MWSIKVKMEQKVHNNDSIECDADIFFGFLPIVMAYRLKLFAYFGKAFLFTN